MKIHAVGAELIHADGRTDLMRQMVAFRNFEKAPTNCSETPLKGWWLQLLSNTDRQVAKVTSISASLRYTFSGRLQFYVTSFIFQRLKPFIYSSSELTPETVNVLEDFLDMWIGPSQWLHLHTTTQTYKEWVFIQASVEIRTKDPNFPPRSHCDRHIYYSLSKNSAISLKMEEEGPKHHTVHRRSDLTALTLRSFILNVPAGNTYSYHCAFNG
jgi:hypothetical protein